MKKSVWTWSFDLSINTINLLILITFVEYTLDTKYYKLDISNIIWSCDEIVLTSYDLKNIWSYIYYYNENIF